MILVREIKLKPEHTPQELKEAVCRILRCREQDIRNIQIARRSIDARRKPELLLVYEVWVLLASCRGEEEERAWLGRLLQKRHRQADAKRLEVIARPDYTFPCPAPRTWTERMPRPVVVGMGPAGLFCGLLLARAGFQPILLERGAPVEERVRDVETFWNGGALKPDSNVQFGEGGAGTFSDGKLNTLVKESKARHRFVLETFVQYGAPEDILYDAKPHIGTDVLRDVVVRMRRDILAQGGHVLFHHRVQKIEEQEGMLLLTAEHAGREETYLSPAVCLAIGHSARDTFRMLYAAGVPMEAKPFAVGVRMEHPQRMIDRSQYGTEDRGSLPAASYKLTAKTDAGRGVYSFCMCPGGYVVNASSVPGQLAVNGMSDRARDSRNANSAVIVTVGPEDFPDQTVLGGMHFQEMLEKRAYALAGGKIPVQCYGDFAANRTRAAYGEITPCVKGSCAFANLRELFPEEISQALLEAIPQFGRKIRGYDREDALLSGVESRTSSPVRILRDETLQSSLAGLYPCGEGAGYAGGITSAAIDGIRVAEQMAGRLLTLFPENGKNR